MHEIYKDKEEDWKHIRDAYYKNSDRPFERAYPYDGITVVKSRHINAEKKDGDKDRRNYECYMFYRNPWGGGGF